MGGGVDDVAVVLQRVEDIAENHRTHGEQHCVGPNRVRQGGREDDATDAEQDDEISANDERIVAHENLALGLGRPPTGRIVIGRTVTQAASYAKIGAVEDVRDVGGMDEKDGKLAVEDGQSTHCRQPAGYDAHDQNREVAHHDAPRQVVGSHQRGVAPAEEDGTHVEIGDRQGRCRFGPRRAPLVMAVQQESDGKGDEDQCRKQSRTAIHVVLTKPQAVVDQCEGHHKVEAGGDNQHYVIKVLLHRIVKSIFGEQMQYIGRKNGTKKSIL